jgi:hypothetical protein
MKKKRGLAVLWLGGLYLSSCSLRFEQLLIFTCSPLFLSSQFASQQEEERGGAVGIVTAQPSLSQPMVNGQPITGTASLFASAGAGAGAGDGAGDGAGGCLVKQAIAVEDGTLIAITIPQGVVPGQAMRISTSKGVVDVFVPAGSEPGQRLQTRLPPGHALV